MGRVKGNRETYFYLGWGFFVVGFFCLFVITNQLMKPL